MAAATDYTENQILDWVTGVDSMPATGTRYLSAHTSATTDAGGGTEVSGNGYARKSLASLFSAASGTGGSVSNNADVAFAAASGGNWGTITHIAIWDASTAGNMLWHGALTASKVINDGDQLVFTTGNLTITVA